MFKITTLVDIQIHCARLSNVLSELWFYDPVTMQIENEDFEFGGAAEWLDVAAGIHSIGVLTSRFDKSLMYCELAMEYEDARSESLSKLVKELTIFLYAWGAFEIVTKVVNLPSIPRKERWNGSNSLVDQTIHYINSIKPVPGYSEVLYQYQECIKQSPDYFKQKKTENRANWYTLPGIGIDYVRVVRNKFAHGALSLLATDNQYRWNNKVSKEAQLIELSVRLILFTIQMVLKKYYQKNHFLVSVLMDENGMLTKTDIHTVLDLIHLDSHTI